MSINRPSAEETDEFLDADVEEFARHNRGGGWALAHLVVRRVEYDADHGRSFEQQAKRSVRNVFRQISAREFARRAKTDVKRVLAYYTAWERAASDGLVPPVAKVAAGEYVQVPDEAVTAFYGEQGYYRGYEARMSKGERRDALEAEAELAGVTPRGPVYVAEHPTSVRAAVIADPVVCAAALEGLAEIRRRESQDQDELDRTAAREATEARARELDGLSDSWSPGGDDDARGDDGLSAEQAAAAVRSASRSSEVDAALQVFNELAQVRMGTLRILSLLQQNPVHFTGDRGEAITKLCEASKAAIDFIRDLAASPLGVLDDESLRAFLEESERLG